MNFEDQYLGKWEPMQTAVFSREEVALLVKHGYVPENTAETLINLCYETDPDSKGYQITHRRTNGERFNRERIMELKRIAAALRQDNDH